MHLPGLYLFTHSCGTARTSSVNDNEHYCVNEDNIADDALVPFAEAWKYRTLAECCYRNFHHLYGTCMGDYFDKETDFLPCTPPPELSGLWYMNYFDWKDGACVQECELGDSCNGRASQDKDLYLTYGDCCHEQLGWLENSACVACSENFWENYFATDPPPTKGYYPICEPIPVKLCFSNLSQLSHFSCSFLITRARFRWRGVFLFQQHFRGIDTIHGVMAV